MQEPQPFGVDLLGEKIDAGRVATRLGEALDKAKLNRVFPHAKHHRNRRGRRLRGDRNSGDAGRGNHGHVTPNQVGHECRQAIVLALHPVILDATFRPST